MRTPTPSDLRSLDAADSTLTVEQQQRATTLLEQILTTPTYAPVDVANQPPARTRRPLKVIAILASAVTLAVATVVVPGLGRPSKAYATWTATPSPVSAPDLSTVAQACRENVRDKTGDHLGPGGGTTFDSATIPVALAERRGDLVMILFHQNNPDNIDVACVATNVVGSPDTDDLNIGIGGGSGPARTPTQDRITQGSISQFGSPSPASATEGTVGSNVAEVTIHSAGQTVAATVKDGRYAAWWPGNAFTDAPRQPNGQGGPRVNITYDVTLNNGTTLNNVRPATP